MNTWKVRSSLRAVVVALVLPFTAVTAPAQDRVKNGPCADSKTVYVRFDGTSRESPTVKVRGSKISLMFLESCGCCEVHGLSVEGSGGSYFFKEGGTFSIQPGTYRLAIAGKITTGGGVCAGGDLTALVCYNFWN
jgi:hypothetical protein